MKLKVLGSSSKGNCYLLQNEDETLIIECGFTYKKILNFLSFNLKNVIGCLITHEHKDHSKAALDLMKNGIDVYASKGTLEAIEVLGHRANIVTPGKQFKVGGFTILPFETEHDSNEPIGFLVQHKDTGKILFATDTYYIRYKFKGLNHILIECNYKESILEENVVNGVIPKSLKGRIERSHFSIENVKEFFYANDLEVVKTVALLHLSGENSNPESFKDEIAAVTGKEIHIATPGLEIDLSFHIKR